MVRLRLNELLGDRSHYWSRKRRDRPLNHPGFSKPQVTTYFRRSAGKGLNFKTQRVEDPMKKEGSLPASPRLAAHQSGRAIRGGESGILMPLKWFTSLLLCLSPG
jgi:hypothetical protein